MALGKIIISPNLKVLREIINHKNAYFIKNYENVFEWKKNIRIAKNSEKNYIMSKNNLILSKKYDHFKELKLFMISVSIIIPYFRKKIYRKDS